MSLAMVDRKGSIGVVLRRNRESTVMVGLDQALTQPSTDPRPGAMPVVVDARIKPVIKSVIPDCSDGLRV